MEIIVFAEQYQSNQWGVWEHKCDSQESQALFAGAVTMAKERPGEEGPELADYMESARRLFNVGVGPVDNPQDGDLRVYCVVVDNVVIGVFEKIRQYSRKVAETHRTAVAAPRNTATRPEEHVHPERVTQERIQPGRVQPEADRPGFLHVVALAKS
jgi:hypothetical protein